MKADSPDLVPEQDIAPMAEWPLFSSPILMKFIAMKSYGYLNKLVWTTEPPMTGIGANTNCGSWL